MLSLKRPLILAVAAAVFLTRFTASANILQVLPELGDLERWAVFSLGNGHFSDKFSQGANVQSDVGIAGNGNLNMNGTATINGDLYYRSTGTLKISQSAHVTGNTFFNQDPLLDNGVNEALAASVAAFGMAPTMPDTNILLTNANRTITGGPGETVVLNLKSFILKGNSTFTLQGTATTNFVINVSNKFSLGDTSKIVLSGGLQWDDVVFNVTGVKPTVGLSGNSTFRGILLASKRSVKLKGNATVFGEIIANRISFSEGSRVNRPPISSP